MQGLNWLKELTKFLHTETYDLLKSKENELFELEISYNRIKNQNDLIAENFKELQDTANNYKLSKEDLLKQIKSLTPDTELETFCKTNYTEIPKLAYRDKRYSVKKIFIDMFPNETIRPDCFEINRVRRQLGTAVKNILWYKKVGDFVTKKLRWVSDKNAYGVDDYYCYPSEALKTGVADCEGFSAVVSSIEPEIGIAFGFAGNTAHAWNVFVQEGELYSMETNSILNNLKNANIFVHDKQDFYKIHFIFTKNKTYRVNAGVEFGQRATY